MAIMNEFVSEVILGRGAKNLSSGVSVSDAIQTVSFLLHTAAAQDPLNMATGGLAGRLGLVKAVRDAKVLYAEVMACLYSDYELRLGQPSSKLSMNLLDISIQHNRTCPKDKKLSVDEIIQFCLDMRSSA